LRKLIILFLAAAAGFSAHCSVFAADKLSGAKVFAYYFHGDMRCPTCLKLEMYSRQALEENFKDAMSSGKLEFKVINVDENKNRHFVDDYQLYSKSLVLSLVKDGKEIRSKNLTKIWEYALSKEKFFDYIKKETSAFLEGS
jgi:hypothetical protein